VQNSPDLDKSVFIYTPHARILSMGVAFFKEVQKYVQKTEVDKWIVEI
jgi:hypothetical protein